MNLSINPRHFMDTVAWENSRSLTEAMELVFLAGFHHFDLEATTREEVDEILKFKEDHNVTIIQSHMPFNRYTRLPHEIFRQSVADYATYAKEIGSKILVVHGDDFDYKNNLYTRTAALEHNYRFFYSMVEYAAANHMKVAFENTFQESHKLTQPHYGASVDDLCELVDRYNTDTVGVCWDTGHAKVQYAENDIEALKIAGSRVICTHIHDNYYKQDLHGFPFTGDIHWKNLMQALDDIGYKGDLSFEFVYDRLPKALAPDYLKLLYRTGEYLINEATK